MTGTKVSTAVTRTNAKDNSSDGETMKRVNDDHVPADRKPLEAVILGLHARVGVIDRAGDDDDARR